MPNSTLAVGSYKLAPKANYVLLNTELPEDDTLVAIEYFAIKPNLVFFDVRDLSR